MSVSQVLVAATLVVAVLAIVGLSLVVLRLSRQVALVAAHVEQLPGTAPVRGALRDSEPVVAAPGGLDTGRPEPVEAPDEQTAAVTPDESEQRTSVPRTDAPAAGEHVRVITGIDEPVDDDLTTARIASVTLGGPLIKVASFSHGVRRALTEERRMRIGFVVRKELKRQRKMRRRRRAQRAPSQGWRP